MSERILVTGASGQIGLPLVKALVGAGHEVVGLVRTPANEEVVRAAGATVLSGSLYDPEALARAVEGVTVVYHLAGGIRGKGPETADVINRQGMEGLLAAIDRVGTGALESLVYTSSSAVYGDRGGLVVDEELPAQPDTRYGQSKLDAERLLLDAAAQRGVPARVVRLAAVYGEGFPFMLVDLIKAGRARLPGEGRNTVPTIHVDDALRGLRLVAEGGQDGRIYNLADTEPVILKQFYGKVHQLVGGKPVWFWSTWVPTAVQMNVARLNERLQSRLPRRPYFTPDNLKLFRNSSRLRIDRIQSELGMEWAWPSALDGLEAVLGGR